VNPANPNVRYWWRWPSAALAHRLQPIACAALLERVDERGHDAGAAGTQRVADGDGAAVDVGLGQISPAICSPSQHDGLAARHRAVESCRNL
jgi:hypothetical protein